MTVERGIVLEIYLSGEHCGELKISRDGLMAVFEADCQIEGSGIFRLYVFEGNRELYLGILEPLAGVWKLRRSISGSKMRQVGVTDPDRAVCLPPGVTVEAFTAGLRPSWREVETLSGYITSDLTDGTDLNSAGVLIKEDDDETLLAFPAAEHEPFNLEPLFCFAEIAEIAGKHYAVFKLNTKGDSVTPKY